MYGSFSKLPGGNVRPSRFVVLQTNNTIVESGAGANVWGISQASTRHVALAGWDDGFAGILGDGAINVFGPGDDECALVLGGTVAVGDRLKSGAAGVGITTVTVGDAVGAIALRAGVSGDVIPVKPIRYDI